MKKPGAVVDLHALDEDQRIAMIGHVVTAHQKRVAFIVDDVPGKADRYITKLLERFPGIICEGPTRGPTPGVLTVTARPHPFPKPESAKS